MNLQILKDFPGHTKGEKLEGINPDRAIVTDAENKDFAFMYGYRASDLIREGFARQVDIPDDEAWLIWSIEHTGWWAPDWNGYVEKKKDAGRYTFKEALKIVKGANINNTDKPYEAMIKYAD